MIDYAIKGHTQREREVLMEGILTVKALISELEECDPDQPVMIVVCKYPEEFAWRRQPGQSWSWMNSTDTEVIPLESEDITEQEGMIVFCVELTDYSEQRHFAGG